MLAGRSPPRSVPVESVALLRERGTFRRIPLGAFFRRHAELVPFFASTLRLELVRVHGRRVRLWPPISALVTRRGVERHVFTLIFAAC